VKLEQVVSVSGEYGIGIERDLESTLRQFLHHVENVPPRFPFVGGIADPLNVDEIDLFPPMVKALFDGVPAGDGGVATATFVVVPMN
jgi:hypothetical protein